MLTRKFYKFLRRFIPLKCYAQGYKLSEIKKGQKLKIVVRLRGKVGSKVARSSVTINSIICAKTISCISK